MARFICTKINISRYYIFKCTTKHNNCDQFNLYIQFIYSTIKQHSFNLIKRQTIKQLFVYKIKRQKLLVQIKAALLSYLFISYCQNVLVTIITSLDIYFRTVEPRHYNLATTFEFLNIPIFLHFFSFNCFFFFFFSFGSNITIFSDS